MESLLIHPFYTDENKNNIYILREDLLPFSFGGNKYRIALKYIQDMKQKKCTVMVGYGSPQSNLSRILANLCKANGIRCILIVSRETSMEKDIETYFNSKLLQGMSIEMHFCEKKDVPHFVPALLTHLEKQGEKPYYIYSSDNISAAISAYEEVYILIEQWEDYKKQEFEKIFLACGTGMTLSGLICANKNSAKKRKPEIVGISIAREKSKELNVIQEYVDCYVSSKNRKVFKIDSSVLVDDYLCEGYGRYNLDIEDTIKNTFYKTGVPLDPTYTGKAFWGMQQELLKSHVNHKNILFIHTGGAPLFFDYLNYGG